MFNVNFAEYGILNSPNATKRSSLPAASSPPSPSRWSCHLCTIVILLACELEVTRYGTYVTSVFQETLRKFIPRKQSSGQWEHRLLRIVLCECFDHTSVCFTTLIWREDGPVPCRRGESSLKSRGDEACVTVDVIPDCQERNSSVSYP